MTERKPTLRLLLGGVACGLWVLALVALPLAAEGPGASQEVVDRIQRECLRAYTPEMLRAMTAGKVDEIPAAVEASPGDQHEFLDQVLTLDKGPFYPFILEDLLPAFEEYVKPGARFLDLGSGDGRVLFLANVLGADATGIEYDPKMVETSQRALEALGDLMARQRLHIVQGDFFESSWSEYDVVFYFDLTSFEHDRLRHKIASELDPGARLLVGHQRAPFLGLTLETTFESIHVYRQPQAAMNDPTLTERCEKEVVELHRFLEDWYNGALAPTEENLARFAGVLAPSFLLVSTDGRTSSRATLVDGLRKAHGTWREPGSDEPGAGRIRIERFRTRLIDGPVALATYEEWREVGGEVRGRTSTVVFRLEHGLPNGVAWYHLQETWLP